MGFELTNEQIDQFFTDAQTVYNSASTTTEKMTALTAMLLCQQISTYRGSLPYGGNKNYSGPA